jgi:hypothetical protein
LPLFFSIFAAPAFARELETIDSVAEAYVKLALDFGRYEADYVDSYYGPQEWLPQDSADAIFPYVPFHQATMALLDRLAAVDTIALTPSQRTRVCCLEKLIQSLGAMIDMRNGHVMTFDEESEALYDAVAPSHDTAYLDSLLQRLDHLLPGTGDIPTRLIAFQKLFVVPNNRLDTLIRVSIAACRARTCEHIQLPEAEDFVVEYVANAPWGAYNWYEGNSISTIQIDTTDKIRIGGVISIAAHEGYPGHHVYCTLAENCLYRDSGWVEYCVLPLQCPASLIAEGLGNYAARLVFPGEERASFMKTVLFPLAGLDTSMVDLLLNINDLRRDLNAASAEAARSYLDGKSSKDETATFLMRYLGETEEEAYKSIGFFRRYRSYIVNYSLGEDLVKKYVEHDETTENVERRWERFTRLMLNPMTASRMIESSLAENSGVSTGGL